MSVKISTKSTKTITIVTSIHPDFDARIWKHATAMAEAGWNVHLIAPWNPGDVVIPAAIRLHSFKRVQSRICRLPLIPWRVGRKLLAVIRKSDVIHFHDIDLLPWMSLVSLWKHVIYDVHEDYPEEMRIREWIPDILREPFAQMLGIGQRFFSIPIRNIVLTAATLDSEFQGKRFRKIVIPNYATQKLAEGMSHDYLTRQAVVVFIGSQHVNNGSDLLLEISKRLQPLRPKVQFITSDRFATAEIRKAYLAKIEQDSLMTVKLLPNVKPHELMSVLNRATIAISPNLRVKQQINGAHNKIYEFMAAGLPIVASDLPHQTTVIGGSDCGILAQPEDPDTFVNALIRLVDDQSYAKELGEKGRRAFFEKYSWESQMTLLLQFYKKILGY